MSSINVGSILEGKVSKITNFGAFVQLSDDCVGLVHISEVADQYVKDINTHLHEGQIVKVKVLSMDKDGKVNLSIKKANPTPTSFQNNTSRQKNNTATSFEDLMSQFMKDSESKISDLKNRENKRGVRPSKKR